MIRGLLALFWRRSVGPLVPSVIVVASPRGLVFSAQRSLLVASPSRSLTVEVSR